MTASDQHLQSTAPCLRSSGPAYRYCPSTGTHPQAPNSPSRSQCFNDTGDNLGTTTEAERFDRLSRNYSIIANLQALGELERRTTYPGHEGGPQDVLDLIEQLDRLDSEPDGDQRQPSLFNETISVS